MSERIAHLVAALQSQGLNATAEEIADLIWLADRIGLPSRDHEHDRQRNQAETRAANRADTSEDANASVLDLNQLPQPETLSGDPAAAQMFLPGANANGPAGAGGGLSFRSPAGTALPGALDIARALRPLMRRVASRTNMVLDAEATVQRIADERIWAPRLRPANARWLELALVIDESASMAIWQRTVAELRRMLERHGAFRDVRTWGLVTDAADGKPQLRVGIGPAARARPIRSSRELIDPAGRRLILVVSDCVAPAWYGANNQANTLLQTWGEHGPLALIQVLPEWLWIRCGLGDSLPATLRAPAPGVPNARLNASTTLRMLGRAPADRLKIPVLTLDERPIKNWARLMAGAGGAAATGRLLRAPSAPAAPSTPAPTARPTGPAKPNDAISASQHVDHFMSAASDQAYELAELLACVPLSLPVMRLVQETMLPNSRQIHLAEVFLGGLMRSTTPNPQPADADTVQYDFLPGVREQLLAQMPASKQLDVLRKVSARIASEPGQSDFMALLEDSGAAGGATIAAGSLPFASVAASVLRRFGGKYADLAQRLEGSPDPHSGAANSGTSRAPEAAPAQPGQRVGSEARTTTAPQPTRKPDGKRNTDPTNQLRTRALGLASEIDRLNKRLIDAEQRKRDIRRDLRSRVPQYDQGDLDRIERQIEEDTQRLAEVENEHTALEQQIRELGANQPRVANAKPNLPPDPAAPAAQPEPKRPSIPQSELITNWMQIDSSLTVEQVLRRMPPDRVARAYLYILYPTSNDQFVVARWNEIEQIARAIGQNIRDRPIGTLPGLPRPVAGIEQNSMGLTAARELRDAQPGRRLLILSNGQPIGLLATEVLSGDALPADPFATAPRRPAVLGIDDDEAPSSYPTEAEAPPEPLIDNRVLNGWVEGLDLSKPLDRGTRYELNFNVDTPRAGAVIHVAGISAMLSGTGNLEVARSSTVEVTVMIESSDFTLYGATTQILVVPLQGRSKNTVSSTIEPKKIGSGVITALFYLNEQLFQRITFRLQVGGVVSVGERSVTAQVSGRTLSSILTQSSPRSGQTVNIMILAKEAGYQMIVQGGGGARAFLKISAEELTSWIKRVRATMHEIINIQDTRGNYIYQAENTSIPPDISTQAIKQLATVGQWLFDQLFYANSGPDARAIGDLLSRLSRTNRLRIQITAEHFFFPWALLYDGDDLDNPDPNAFWGFKHIIEYMPEFSASSPINFVPTIAVDDTLDMAFVSNTGIDRQFGRPIVQGQLEAFNLLPGVHVKQYSNVQDFINLMRDPKAPPLIYLFCMATSRFPNEDDGVDDSYLTLSDGRLTIRELKLKSRSALPLLTNAPLIFLNACESAELSPYLYDGLLPFMIARGVRGIIGSEVETPAFFAAEFAKEFIRRFTSGGQPLGELLLDIRRAYVLQRNNVLGLAYALYASGDIIIERHDQTTEPPANFAA